MSRPNLGLILSSRENRFGYVRQDLSLKVVCVVFKVQGVQHLITARADTQRYTLVRVFAQSEVKILLEADAQYYLDMSNDGR